MNINSICTSDDLKEQISIMQKKQLYEETKLREKWVHISESIVPSNILKSTILTSLSSGNISQMILSAVISLSTGIIAKKFIKGNLNHPIKSVIGSSLINGLSNLLSSNKNLIKVLPSKLIKASMGVFKLFKK